MLRRWISATDAAPMPTRTTRARMSSNRSSRCARVSTFESFTRRMSFVSGVTRHAAATTGPARAAIPTSSTPTTRRRPLDQSSFSRRSVGTLLGYLSIAGGEPPTTPCSSQATPATRLLAALRPDGRGLADPLAQEVTGRTACVPETQKLDLLDAWRVHEERALDTDAARDPADGDLVVEPAVADAEHRALELLKPFAVPLDDAHAHGHGVTGPDLGDLGLLLLGGERLQDVVHRHGDNCHGVAQL